KPARAEIRGELRSLARSSGLERDQRPLALRSPARLEQREVKARHVDREPRRAARRAERAKQQVVSPSGRDGEAALWMKCFEHHAGVIRQLRHERQVRDPPERLAREEIASEMNDFAQLLDTFDTDALDVAAARGQR